jgi:hypothetical protein
MAKIQVCWNTRNVFIAIRLWSARADDVPWLLLTAFQMQGTPAASDELHAWCFCRNFCGSRNIKLSLALLYE